MVTRVIVDEAVGPNSSLLARFRQTLPPGQEIETVFLAKSHRAIPDHEILHKLLDRQTVLLTSDRVLHNQACALGFRSYTLNPQDQLTGRKLEDIVTPLPIPVRGDHELKEDYAHRSNPIATKLKADFSELDFKRYKTRRRRIRSYFGSASNICHVSLTVGAEPTKRGFLCGYYLFVAGTSGVKGLRASEGYARSTSSLRQAKGGSGQGRPTEQLDDPAFCLIHALRESYLLQLEDIATEVFILPTASLALAQALVAAPDSIASSSSKAALATLLRGLGSVKVFPCVKGRFFDAMESKLRQLGDRGSNELVPVDFARAVASLVSSYTAADFRRIEDEDEDES